ncbi:MAG: hypothetical protein IPL65_17115 [Lewinellaceae bacterium]|nr:hypothetical protein [Lewinellaceae bacterium]
MKREWLLALYEKEVKQLKAKIKEFQASVDSDSQDLRVRDYRTFKACLQAAYNNDKENAQESKITRDEQSILTALAIGLDLSQEELKLINYSTIPLKPLDLDEAIKYTSSIGASFFIPSVT